jgi:hypothetical protein
VLKTRVYKGLETIKKTTILLGCNIKGIIM